MVRRRLARINKQKMYYALCTGTKPDYVLDEYGNRIIDGYDEDGQPYYREAGTESPTYGAPVPFCASLSGNLSELHAREYGVSQDSIYSEIQCVKDYLPLKFGALIWKGEPGTKPGPAVLPDGDILPENELLPLSAEPEIDYTTADYTVTGILDEFIHYDWFLLRRND